METIAFVARDVGDRAAIGYGNAIGLQNEPES